MNCFPGTSYSRKKWGSFQKHKIFLYLQNVNGWNTMLFVVYRSSYSRRRRKKQLDVERFMYVSLPPISPNPGMVGYEWVCKKSWSICKSKKWSLWTFQEFQLRTSFSDTEWGMKNFSRTLLARLQPNPQLAADGLSKGSLLCSKPPNSDF